MSTMTIGSPVPSRALQLSARDPFVTFLDPTMAVGTTLVRSQVAYPVVVWQQTGEYVPVSLDVILDYERTILELRCELFHYKSLLSEFLGQSSPNDELEPASPLVRLDTASVELLNSVLAVAVPPSATFTDFEEEEL